MKQAVDNERERLGISRVEKWIGLRIIQMHNQIALARAHQIIEEGRSHGKILLRLIDGTDELSATN